MTLATIALVGAVIIPAQGSVASVNVPAVGSGSWAQAATAASTAPPSEAYVSAVYRDLFGRSADSTGLRDWTRALATGAPRAAVANSITYSTEYRGRLIQGSYREFLNRDADPGGLQNWLSAMQGGLTIQQMEGGFLASPEYFGRAGSTDQGWVRQLYRHVLNRNAGASEVTGWVSSLNGGASRTDVAMGFLLSSERLATVIDGHYRSLLGRTVDPNGRQSWVRAIQSGTRVEAVIGGIIASDEYYGRNSSLPAGTAGGAAKPATPTPPPPPAPAPTAPPAEASTPGTPAPSPAPTAPSPKPSDGVGVPPGTPLTVHQGNLTITQPGTVIEGLEIRGFVRVRATDVVIRKSVIRGPDSPLTSPMSLVQSDAGSGTNLLIEDSTIFAAAPSRFVDGIVGMGFTLRRVDIHTVIDQVKITGDNVTVDSSHLHSNLFYPADGRNIESHDDNVQIAVGNNIQVINSTLSGTTNAAVMITQDRGSVRNFTFRNNTADNGACTINVAEKAYGPPPGLTIIDNVFGTGQRVPRCAILLPNTTKAVATVQGNTFTDGSATGVSRGS